MIGRSMDEIAAALYGRATPTAQPRVLLDDEERKSGRFALDGDSIVERPMTSIDAVVEVDARSAEQIAQAMHPEQAAIPAAESIGDAELDAARTEAQRYSADAVRAIPNLDALVGQTLEVNGEAVVVTAEQAAAVTAEMRALVTDLGLTRSDMSLIQETLAKPRQSAQEAATATVDGLNADYGNGAAQALKTAQQYVARHPKLAAVLEQTGLGSDPRVVRVVARRAMSLRAHGKFTIGR